MINKPAEFKCVVLSALAVAPHAHHPGDGRLPGEAAGRRERALHSAADAGIPGESAPRRAAHK